MVQDAAIGRSATAFDPDETLCVVVEMSLSSWLVAGLVPGIERRPLKKMGPDEVALFSSSPWSTAGVPRRPAAAARSGASCWPTRRDVTVSGWPLAAGARHRGSRDPCEQCCGVAGPSPGQDRSAGHGASHAGAARLATRESRDIAAWRSCLGSTRRMPSGQPRTREPRRRAHPGDQPHEGGLARLGIRGFNPALRRNAAEISSRR